MHILIKKEMANEGDVLNKQQSVIMLKTLESIQIHHMSCIIVLEVTNHIHFFILLK